MGQSKCGSWWRGRVVMCWESEEVQRMAKSGLKFCCCAQSSQRKPDLMLYQESYRGSGGVLGWETTRCYECWRSLTSNSFLVKPSSQPPSPQVTMTAHAKSYSSPKAVEGQDHQRPEQRKWTMHVWWQIYSLPGSWRSQGNDLGFWRRTLGLNFYLCQGPRPQELEHSILSLGPVVPLLPAPPGSCEVSRICSRRPLLLVPPDFPLKKSPQGIGPSFWASPTADAVMGELASSYKSLLQEVSSAFEQHSTIDGHLHSFHVLAIKNNASMNMGV